MHLGVALAAALQSLPSSAPSRFASAADALAAQFETHQFIFLGSTHGDAKIEEFVTCLITRPEFKKRATDIVVEWAGSGRQRLLDAYLLELKPVSDDDLARIWLDTDAPTLWGTLPQVRRTVEVLREVNSSLPAAKRIRLLGGSEGIDWARVKTPEDLAPYPYKTNFMPDLEEAVPRAQLYVVGTIRALEKGERESLAKFGDPLSPFFVDAGRFPTPTPFPNSLRIGTEEKRDRLAEYLDAVLYLGPEPDRDLRNAIGLSPAQKSELARRDAIRSDPQRVMKARFGGRDRWFREHPADIPPRP